MSKKFLSLLAFAITSVSVVIPSFAMSTGEVYGETPTLAEQYAELSDEQKEIFSNKLNRDRTTLSDIPATASANETWRYVAYFEGFKQETDYWCVPASCQAAVNCLTGVKPSQSSIASALGMVDGQGIAFAYARSYLNSAQSNNLYIHMASTTAEDVMQGDFYDAMQFDAPVLISTRFARADGWQYDCINTGHTMVVYGMTTDLEQVAISDPYAERIYYDMYDVQSFDNVRQAIIDNGCGYMY